MLQEDIVCTIDVRLRRQGFKLAHPRQASDQLQHVDIIVNLLPEGQDFVHCGIVDMIPLASTIVDFSRPPIPGGTGHNIIMGNRLSHPHLRFWPPLPGWGPAELPACSLPCILSAYGDLSAAENDHDFAVIARYMQFSAKNPEGDANA
jgi:hypothetical protein